MKPDVDYVIIKKPKMKFNIILLLFCITYQGFSQGDIPVGTWRTHFNYENAFALEKSNEKIYCLTEQGLYYFDTQGNSISTFSKIDGLSDVSITAMAFESELNVLGIGYANGNIDLVFSNEIFNISIVKNSSIIDNKVINHIAFNNGKVYLATDFGVLVLNPITGEIDEAFQNLGNNGTSLNIKQTLFTNDNIYLATFKGVLQASINSNLNLQDFNNWERFNASIIENQSINSLSFVNNIIYAASTTTLFKFKNASWTRMDLNLAEELIIKIESNADKVLIITESTIKTLSLDGSVSSLILETGANPRDIIVENTDIFWYADFGKGLSKSTMGNVERIIPNGVFALDIARLEIINNTLFAFPKSAVSSTIPQNNNLGYAEFRKGIWSNISPDNLLNVDDITDAVSLNGVNLVISSFGHGVVDLATGTIYDESNSPLVNNNSTGRNVLVTTMDTDQDGNIWVGQIGDNSLLKFTPNKTWESFNLGIIAAQNPKNIQVDEQNQIWILPQFSLNGIIGYNPQTDIVRYFTVSNGNLPNNKVIDMEIDINGQLWIGTEGGLAFLPFTFDAIDDNSIEVLQPIFGNRILFDKEQINAIEIDAANRKWIATNNGLWLFEDAGDKLIYNFNTENSPLPSNEIIDIKADPISGEVFIATVKGLVSFRSDAVKGESFHQYVKIFPNPIHPGYSGLVGISGLAHDATLKITDVSGKLVREINAAGGGASWNIADYNGVRVQTGVYLIFSSNDNGTETFVGKIAIIN